MLVIRGGALRGGAYLLGIVLSLVSVPLMTRHLGTVDYGRVATVMALIALTASAHRRRAYGRWSQGVLREATRRACAPMRAIVGLRMTLTLVGVAAALVFASAIGYSAVLVAGTCLAGIGLLVERPSKGVDDPDDVVASSRLGGRSSWSSCRRSSAFVTLLVLVGAGIVPFFAMYLVSGLVRTRCDGCSDGLDQCHSPAVDLRLLWRALLRDMLPYGAAIADQRHRRRRDRDASSWLPAPRCRAFRVEQPRRPRCSSASGHS